MNIRKEICKTINDKQYNMLKKKIFGNSNQFLRQCNFVREVLFGYQNMDSTSESVYFSLWMNRNNKDVVYLIARNAGNGLVSESKAKLTQAQAMHILNRDYEWMKTCGIELVQQLMLQMKYNLYYPTDIIEYFEENYVNILSKDKITFKLMNLLIENNVKEYFCDNLSALDEIDYKKIHMSYSQNIVVPSITNA